MSEYVECKECGAVSYNGPKTKLVCGKCFDTLRDELSTAKQELEATRTERDELFEYMSAGLTQFATTITGLRADLIAHSRTDIPKLVKALEVAMVFIKSSCKACTCAQCVANAEKGVRCPCEACQAEQQITAIIEGRE